MAKHTHEKDTENVLILQGGKPYDEQCAKALKSHLT